MGMDNEFTNYFANLTRFKCSKMAYMDSQENVLRTYSKLKVPRKIQI